MSDRADVESGKLVYTCNCGWIDKNHAFTSSDTPYVGANKLWQQFNLCTFEARYTNAIGMAPRPFRVQLPEKVVIQCKRDGKARFADGSTGYPVHYKQHMGNKYYKTGVTGHYLIRKDLNLPQRKSVALAIFMQISQEFEGLQAGFPWGVLTDSGFSQEDLVSNLIGFYVAIGEISKQEALDKCHQVPTNDALKIWDVNGSVGSNKNKTFTPQLAPFTGINDDVRRMCRDACQGQSGKFPSVFQSIKPAKYGSLYLKYPTLY